jgi:hypothetical protein
LETNEKQQHCNNRKQIQLLQQKNQEIDYEVSHIGLLLLSIQKSISLRLRKQRQPINKEK